MTSSHGAAISAALLSLAIAAPASAQRVPPQAPAAPAPPPPAAPAPAPAPAPEAAPAPPIGPVPALSEDDEEADEDDDDRDEQDADDVDDRREQETDDEEPGEDRAPVAAVAQVDAPAPAGPRPQGLTLGLGAGYNFPTRLDRPNVVSARLRFGGGVAIEPRIELSNASFTQSFDGMEASTDAGFYALGAQVRIPVASRGRGDLIVVGGASLERAESDPDGRDNAESSTRIGVDWGLAVDYWLLPSLSVSATAINPIIAYADATMEGDLGEETRDSTGLGLVWNPTVTAMLHLFF